jgi:hypothetical protein
MPYQWWNTPWAAWGLLAIGIGVGGLLTYIEPQIGIPIGIIISLTGICLIIRAYLGKYKIRISLKKRGSKVLIGLGIFIILGGIIGGYFLIKLQLNTESNVETTIVYCCINGNTYQVWAANKGNNIDTIFITLGTSGLITDFKANMGASLPRIIEGGKNANFITFEIDKLPPNVSLTYLIPVSLYTGDEKRPRQFTAWSDVTKNNILTKYLGECSEIEFGPLETAPPQ